MIRYVLVGVLLFLVFAVSFAPAGLLDRVISSSTEADLVEPQGTVWQGRGQLVVGGVSLGNVVWDFVGTSLLRATPTYAWSLTQPAWQLQGTAGIGFSNAQLSAAGLIQASATNTWLRAYDISLNGDFSIAPTEATFNHRNRQITAVDGELNWSGGTVRYTLSGVLREATLPPLTAILDMNNDDLPEAVVFAEGQQTPLLIATLGRDGFAKVGITKLFTKLLNNPWPGSDPDHVVVLQVEEKII